jgi:transaldolase
MGASFRNKGEILELAGCDLLTISPSLLAELSSSNEIVEQKLSSEESKFQDIERFNLSEKSFRWELNENAMATEKTADGIRQFSKDIRILEGIIEKRIS